jgi:tetratricopeptide (TPR) repeat protein
MNTDSNKGHKSPIARFELMLQSNRVYFFDTTEFEEIIQFYIDSGSLRLAYKAFEIGENQHPGNCGLKLLHVELMLLNNQYKEAEDVIDKLREMEPFNEYVYIHKAVILSKTKRHQEAISFLTKGLEYCESQAEFHSMLAMEYLFLDSYLMAKEHFIKCLDEDPKDTQALYNLIYCFESLENPDGAIEFLNDYLEADPFSEIAWHQLGRQYSSKGLLKQALSSHEFAVICDSDFIGAYFEMGKTLEKMKRYNEAILAYELTLSIAEPTAFALFRIGQCHIELGNTKLAIHYFKRTLNEDPLYEKAWIALIDLYYRNKDFEKALYYAKKSIQIDNVNVSTWKRYAQINFILGFLEEADLGFTECVNLGNYEVDTWVKWADVLKEMDDYPKAIEILQHGLEFHPESSVINFRIGGIYLLSSQSIEASFYLKNAYMSDAKQLSHFYETFPEFKSSSFVKQSLSLKI